MPARVLDISVLAAKREWVMGVQWAPGKSLRPEVACRSSDGLAGKQTLSFDRFMTLRNTDRPELTDATIQT